MAWHGMEGCRQAPDHAWAGMAAPATKKKKISAERNRKNEEANFRKSIL